MIIIQFQEYYHIRIQHKQENSVLWRGAEYKIIHIESIIEIIAILVQQSGIRLCIVVIILYIADFHELNYKI